MVNTNNNHAIIKNRVGKNNHGINCEILKFLWQDLFIYSKIIYSGKYTSSNKYAPFHSQKG